MATQAQGPTLITARDYLSMPDDGKRYELIAGVMYVTPAPSASRHQQPAGRLFVTLYQHVTGQNLGSVYFSPVDVVLSDLDVPQPDLVFVARERLHIVADQINGAPDLVVEILSPKLAKRDRVLKWQVYERSGVRFYWILDPQRAAIEEYELVDGQYQLVSQVVAGETFRPKLFPGLAIDVAEIFAK